MPLKSPGAGSEIQGTLTISSYYPKCQSDHHHAICLRLCPGDNWPEWEPAPGVGAAEEEEVSLRLRPGPDSGERERGEPGPCERDTERDTQTPGWY